MLLSNDCKSSQACSLKNYWGANKSELGKKKQYHLQIEFSNFLISYRNYVYLGQVGLLS